ncbi:hypothetical protein JTE90_005361 [Oedothorax gibbosus]|uniref:Uncharacterized protein n=1 Tax=Oedothorax gibbosus TaxID=931172 RepID=A0AAV6TSP6_9ARAC|nr:hypothetical protein JTE90_005361 [Oedothorax gibbosus]
MMLITVIAALIVLVSLGDSFVKEVNTEPKRIVKRQHDDYKAEEQMYQQTLKILKETARKIFSATSKEWKEIGRKTLTDIKNIHQEHKQQTGNKYKFKVKDSFFRVYPKDQKEKVRVLPSVRPA